MKSGVGGVGKGGGLVGGRWEAGFSPATPAGRRGRRGHGRSRQEFVVLFPASAREFSKKNGGARFLPHRFVLATRAQPGCNIDAWEPDGFQRRAHLGVAPS